MRLFFYSSNRPTDASIESGADMLVTGILSLLLLANQCVSAPQVPGNQRIQSAGAIPPFTLANPFGSGEEDRRLLQSYIKANLKEGHGGPDNTWEQEVFFLFRLHDYDRSGHMDGLEMMKLLSEYNSHNAPGEQSAETVVAMVDFLLQTQDLNQDGLIAPPELLSPPKLHPDSNSQGAPEQEGGADVKEGVNIEEPKQEEAEQEEKEAEEQLKEEESRPGDGQ
ncbi:cell growth regulator with EF hand domain protein 1 [Salmo salar]|uniref:Cell growth regulator with EF hand domain protein 1 n=1 Tax=Salmo salar TaxID=8030 RepID=A0A1S3SRM6_SALSA|nr:cell growth regulator with EF hand domain protein 1-like [Salmo salar]|eukprot:XP_014066991.1 PREDICTED: cell growth regulator with EF hand domain protein 1-like [Salmo salar]